MKQQFTIENDVLTACHGTAPDAVIPDGVTKIRVGAFARCGALETANEEGNKAEVSGFIQELKNVSSVVYRPVTFPGGYST